jgi:hypothetical protein
MKGGMIAMRTEYLAAITIAVLATCTGLAMNSLGSLTLEKQSMPAASQIADRLAVSVDPLKQSMPAATQIADRLAVSVDPFLMRSSG